MASVWLYVVVAPLLVAGELDCALDDSEADTSSLLQSPSHAHSRPSQAVLAPQAMRTNLCDGKDAFGNVSNAHKYFVSECQSTYGYSATLCISLGEKVFEGWAQDMSAIWNPGEHVCDEIVDLLLADRSRKSELDLPLTSLVTSTSPEPPRPDTSMPQLFVEKLKQRQGRQGRGHHELFDTSVTTKGGSAHYNR